MTTNLINSTNKVPNVPPLRFPEFTGEWEKSTLGGIADIVGGGTPETDRKEYWNGEIIWYTPSEIGKNKYSSDSERHITQEGLDNSSAKLLPSGTILLSTRATIGESSIALNKCTTNQGFQSLIAQRGIYHEFLYYLIATKKHELVKRACGSTFLEISANEVRKVPVLVPLFKEQYKLSTFLGLIDQRIETQNKIIQHLESLIKGISQHLFGMVSSKFIPLSQLCNIQKGQQVNSEELTESGKYYMMNGGIIPSGYYDKYNTESNTISISEGGNSCGYVQYNDCRFWSGGHCYTITDIKSNISTLYLFHYLKFKEQDIMALRIGSGLPNIQKKDIAKFPVLVLPKKQQEQITNLLQSITTKIKVEKDCLANLSQQKQYRLQQMFI